MELTVLVRLGLLFATFSTTLALNLDDNIFSRLGFNENVGFILLAASVLTYVVSNRTSFVIVSIVLLSLIANMPADFSLNLGFDRDYYAGFMFALAFQPMIQRAME